MKPPARHHSGLVHGRYFCPVTRRDLALISEIRTALADGSARRRRISARVRLVEIAAVAGVSPAAASMWEHAKREPGAENALAYARALAAAEQKAA